MSSSGCPEKDLKRLMWEYSLPEVLQFKQFCDIREALEEAHRRDEDLKTAK